MDTRIEYTYIISAFRGFYQDPLCRDYARTSVVTISIPNITGSPAGLSRVNGVRRSSAETRNFNRSPKAQFNIN